MHIKPGACAATRRRTAERHLDVEHRVVRAIDLSHPAAAEQLDDPISFCEQKSWLKRGGPGDGCAHGVLAAGRRQVARVQILRHGEILSRMTGVRVIRTSVLPGGM